MGNYDELRFVFGTGEHLDEAALHPDDFLRMVPEPATVVFLMLGFGLLKRRR